MGDFLEFPDILQEVRGAMNPGRLKLQRDKVIFRNVKTGKVDQYSPSDVEKVAWLIRAKGHCLKFVMSNGAIHRYDGFREVEFDKLASFVRKSYDKELKKTDVALKGWNWGAANFIGNTLDFEVGGNTAFELPLNYVSHSTTGKNEVTLEFHQNDEAPMSLMELRFHIPTDATNETDPVEEFYTKVMQQADIIQATGESIAILPEVYCLTPRGRYDIKIYPTFMQLHGKTFDYKIPYTTILRFFLLPHRDGRQMFFVISLDPPIKQGQTRYPFLILLFSKDMETTLELSLSEEAIHEKYEGKLEKEMSGPEYEIISRIMKTLVQRKITVPGSFVGHSGSNSIACSYKAATGYLYPLERGFIFVHKPPLHIRFDEISCVNFARSSGSTRSFDFDVETKNGIEFAFVGMEKDEYGKLFDFVSQKKLRVKNTGDAFKTGPVYDDTGSDDDGPDDDFDPYLKAMKREGQEREDSDESSEDEDFVAPESGSEVAEEYDTDYTDSESSEEGEEGEDGKPKKKKKKTITIKEPGMSRKREKREKKEKSGGGGKKKKKDPNAPKRPQTAYFLWLNEHREQIKEEHPGISVTDLAKKGGEMWKEVTAEDKTRYDEEHKRLKDEYDEKMREYQEKKANEPESDHSATGSPKPKKKKTSKSAPALDTKAGSGGNYKSKEFISDSESEIVSESDSDDKPLKPKAGEKEKKKKKKKKSKKESEEEQASESDDEVEEKRSPPKGRKSKRQAGGDASDAELPSDEEDILSSPAHSEPGSAASGSE